MEATIAKQTLLLGGDVIVSINGVPLINLATGTQIMNALRTQDSAKFVDVKIWRQGKTKSIRIPLNQSMSN